MKAQIIQIGNSQGIRIPKMMLEESRIDGDVDLELCEEGILIRSAHKPRRNWDAMFKAAAENEDTDVLNGPPNAFDEKEWQW